MKNFIIAHDLGTTGNKATLYNREGELVGSSFSAYATDYPETGWAEQDPEQWWEAVCSSSGSLLENTNTPKSDVACIVFSGQMMGCVPVDRSAQPLRQAVIWADQRAVRQISALSEKISPRQVYRITGHRLHASYSLAKMLWIRDHQPEIYKAAYKFLQAKDSIAARLTGNFVSEASDASGTNIYDLERKAWSGPVMQAAELDEKKLPRLIGSTECAGTVQPEAARQCGLAPGTDVIIGGGDSACAAAGAGVTESGSAFNYIGSSAWIAVASRKPVYDPEMRTFTFGHVVPGMVTPTGTMQAAGASFQWTRDRLCPLELRCARELGISPYELMNTEAEDSSPGSNGLLFLPYLMGERSPRWNTKARGAFIGLTIRHKRSDMIRAVLEGVTLNLKVILDAFQRQNTEIPAVRMIGGGAGSRLWNRIAADVYGIPVHRLAVLEEATSMGAAVTGGVGVGLYKDFSILKEMNPVSEIVQPLPEAREVYRRMEEIFEEAYHALTPVFEKLG